MKLASFSADSVLASAKGMSGADSVAFSVIESFKLSIVAAGSPGDMASPGWRSVQGSDSAYVVVIDLVMEEQEHMSSTSSWERSVASGVEKGSQQVAGRSAVKPTSANGLKGVSEICL